MRILIVIVALNLVFSSCVNFAQEKGGTTNRNKSIQKQPAEPALPAKAEGESADDQNEASGDELERNTPAALRKLTRCIIEESVSISPDGVVALPVAITFDSSASTAPCGKLVKWTWDFGDGEKAGGAKVTHVYSAPGEYIVRLRLIDNKGNRNQPEIDYAVSVTSENVSTEKLARRPGKTPRPATQRRAHY